MLYLVEFADWDSQEKIGYGGGNGSSTENMGATDSMPYHTGTKTSRPIYSVGVQYRWIEGLWDNAQDWLDGCYNNRNGLNVILNPAEFSDTTGGMFVGVPIYGFPTVMDVAVAGNTQWMYPAPTTAQGSETTYIPDSWGFDASHPCLHCGSEYIKSRTRGLFFVNCCDVSIKHYAIGCRLQKLPDPEEGASA